MSKVLNFIKFILIVIVGLVLMFVMLFGAILQESYKLYPVTEEERMEVLSNE